MSNIKEDKKVIAVFDCQGCGKKWTTVSSWYGHEGKTFEEIEHLYFETCNECKKSNCIPHFDVYGIGPEDFHEKLFYTHGNSVSYTPSSYLHDLIACTCCDCKEVKKKLNMEDIGWRNDRHKKKKHCFK